MCKRKRRERRSVTWNWPASRQTLNDNIRDLIENVKRSC